MKIKKNIEIHGELIKSWKSLNSLQELRNHVTPRNPCDNHENHDNLRNLCENNENLRNPQEN